MPDDKQEIDPKTAAFNKRFLSRVDEAIRRGSVKGLKPKADGDTVSPDPCPPAQESGEKPLDSPE